MKNPVKFMGAGTVTVVEGLSRRYGCFSNAKASYRWSF